MFEQQSFGNWLRLKRKALDLTREALADRVGCSAATIRKIEAEERRPSEQIAERLAEILNVPQNERKEFIRFTRGNWKSAPVVSNQVFPWNARRSNIPATTTSLIGRGEEITIIRQYLSKDDIRLVTLVGPPGIGKTRLSLAVARAALSDFPDGVFFVALASLEDPALIAQTVVQSLGFAGVANLPIPDRLKEGIGEKHLLIVLDNCEHLVEEAALFASSLLSACLRLKILATSRESLRIPGEWQYPVPAFDLPAETSTLDLETFSHLPALTLFTERARAVRPDFELTAGNVGTVSAICTRLDGLPLAIELMAARMRLMPPEMLLARMDSEFILSADGMRAASERQKTLNHAIAWSYNLLSAEEKRLFAYLSVFSGGFTLDAAEGIFSPAFMEKSVPDLIASLLDKSLLQPSLNQVYTETRYIMLVTIQEFARNRLRDFGRETEARNWHLAYFLKFAEQADEELRGPNQLEWLHRVGTMLDNLRTALEWAIETHQTEAALRLVSRLDWFWMTRSDHTEGRQWLERVLQLPDTPEHPSSHAELLAQLAHHVFLQVGEHQQRPLIEQALHIAGVHNDKHNTARALAMLGLNLVEEKKYAAARAALEESAVLYREVHDEWGHAHAVMCLGYGFNEQDDLDNALSSLEHALTLSRKIGDRFLTNVILRGVAIVQVKQNNMVDALAALQESLLLAHQLESKLEVAGTLSRLGKAEQRAGNHVRAVCLLLAAKNLFDLVGAWPQRYEFDLEKDLEPCRAVLGDAAFADAVERGRAMTMEQAIQYALSEQSG